MTTHLQRLLVDLRDAGQAWAGEALIGIAERGEGEKSTAKSTVITGNSGKVAEKRTGNPSAWLPRGIP